MTGSVPLPATLAAVTVLAGAAAVAAVAAEARGAHRALYVFKPLATALLVLLVVAAPAPPSERYRLLVAAGLVFSLAGDVFLMLPADRFLAGLASFLVTHVLYTAAFLGEAGPLAPFAAGLAGYLLTATLLVRWLSAGVPPGLRLPVAV